MKILFRAEGSRDLCEEGCDYILVPVNEATAEVMARRMALYRQVYAGDEDVHQLSFWDFSISLLNGGEWEDELCLEDKQWVFLPDSFEPPGYRIVHSDLRLMLVSRCGNGCEIEWSLNPKDYNTTFTTGWIPLDDIRRRLHQSPFDSIVDRIFTDIMG